MNIILSLLLVISIHSLLYTKASASILSVGNPSEADARELIRKNFERGEKTCNRLIDFTKTDGVGKEIYGQKLYTLEYKGEYEVVGDDCHLSNSSNEKQYITHHGSTLYLGRKLSGLDNYTRQVKGTRVPVNGQIEFLLKESGWNVKDWTMKYGGMPYLTNEAKEAEKNRLISLLSSQDMSVREKAAETLWRQEGYEPAKVVIRDKLLRQLNSEKKPNRAQYYLDELEKLDPSYSYDAARNIVSFPQRFKPIYSVGINYLAKRGDSSVLPLLKKNLVEITKHNEKQIREKIPLRRKILGCGSSTKTVISASILLKNKEVIPHLKKILGQMLTAHRGTCIALYLNALSSLDNPQWSKFKYWYRAGGWSILNSMIVGRISDEKKKGGGNAYAARSWKIAAEDPSSLQKYRDFKKTLVIYDMWGRPKEKKEPVFVSETEIEVKVLSPTQVTIDGVLRNQERGKGEKVGKYTLYLNSKGKNPDQPWQIYDVVHHGLDQKDHKHIQASKPKGNTNRTKSSVNLSNTNQDIDNSLIIGTWDINANNYKGKLEITHVNGKLSARMNYDIYNAWEKLSNIDFNGSIFTASRMKGEQIYTGHVSGDFIEGKFTYQGKTYPWNAERLGTVVKTNKLQNANISDEAISEASTFATLVSQGVVANKLFSSLKKIYKAIQIAKTNNNVVFVANLAKAFGVNDKNILYFQKKLLKESGLSLLEELAYQAIDRFYPENKKGIPQKSIAKLGVAYIINSVQLDVLGMASDSVLLIAEEMVKLEETTTELENTFISGALRNIQLLQSGSTRYDVVKSFLDLTEETVNGLRAGWWDWPSQVDAARKIEIVQLLLQYRANQINPSNFASKSMEQIHNLIKEMDSKILLPTKDAKYLQFAGSVATVFEIEGWE